MAISAIQQMQGHVTNGSIFDPMQQPRIRELLDKLRAEPPKAPKIFTLEEDSTMTCMCGHKRLKSSMPLIDSGVVKYRSKLCTGCRAIDKRWCPIVCATCKDVLAYKEPDVADPVDGFVFQAGVTYHTPRCLNCDPKTQLTFIVERRIWQQRNGPVRTHVSVSQPIIIP